MPGKKEEDLQPLLSKVYEVGIDEVGKGAVFGPVFSAVVVLNKKNKFILKQLGVRDSKKLSPKKENHFCRKFYYFLQIMELDNLRSKKLISSAFELQLNCQW